MKREIPVEGRFARYLFLLLAVGVIAGCVATPRSRVLPPHVRSVYVPMVKNDASEIDVEEDLTRSLQEAFLHDGRLKVSGRSNADLVLECVVRDYQVAPVHFENDEFPAVSDILIRAEVTAYDPFDFDKVTPLGKWEEIEQRFTFSSNTRVMFEEVDVDSKRRALEALAWQVVLAVITEPPTDLDEEEDPNNPLSTARARFRSSYEL